jgi:hypothetical protein
LIISIIESENQFLIGIMDMGRIWEDRGVGDGENMG